MSAPASPPEPEPEFVSPRLAFFLIPLPEPLPIPHGSTYTFLGVASPELTGFAFQPTDETQPLPDTSSGRIFTSLRFWQRLDQQAYDREMAEFEVVHDVARALAPPEAFERFREEYERWEQEELEQEETPEPHPGEAYSWLGDPELDDDEFSRTPAYVTIVEGVTPIVHVDDTDAMSAAYDRVVNAISDLVRAYRIASRLPVAPVTAERLSFSIYYLTRNAAGEADWSHGLFLRHLVPPQAFTLAPMTPEQMESFNTHLTASKQGHPLVPLAERAVDASRALRLRGDTSNAVILTQLMIEILLDTTLELLLLDEGAGAEDAAATLALPLTRKVATQFAPRLGGRWDLRQGIVADWLRDVYRLRGRVIHGGYVPTRGEAWQAVATAEAFERFVRDRIGSSRTRYPRTALLILGVTGLERMGVWSGQIKRRNDEIGDGLLTEYNAWHEALEALELSQ